MSVVQIAPSAKRTLHRQAVERGGASDRIHYLDNLRALAMLSKGLVTCVIPSTTGSP